MTISVSDRLGSKTTVSCYNTDTIKQLKEKIAKKLGARPEKIKLQKWNIVYQDHITIYDYDLSDGMNLEMYNY